MLGFLQLTQTNPGCAAKPKPPRLNKSELHEAALRWSVRIRSSFDNSSKFRGCEAVIYDYWYLHLESSLHDIIK
jgi:hypothetical protein